MHAAHARTHSRVRYPRYLVEFKPAIGHVFEEHLAGYSHWAFGDLDVIMGDAAAWIEPSELADYDVFTYSFGDQASARRGFGSFSIRFRFGSIPLGSVRVLRRTARRTSRILPRRRRR
jgi:hypothetical protein